MSEQTTPDLPMKTVNVSQKYIDSLVKEATQETRRERGERKEGYFAGIEWFGSHVDDAYDGGVEDGEIYAARSTLQAMGIDFSVVVDD